MEGATGSIHMHAAPVYFCDVKGREEETGKREKREGERERFQAAFAMQNPTGTKVINYALHGTQQ